MTIDRDITVYVIAGSESRFGYPTLDRARRAADDPGAEILEQRIMRHALNQEI